jgi:hypothetical protein
MRERLLALAERRAHLAARAQTEREALAALLVPADGAGALAAMLLRTVRRAMEAAQRQPLLAIAGVALLAVLRPRRALTWLARGWSLWRLYQGARGWWLRFAAANPPAPRRRA